MGSPFMEHICVPHIEMKLEKVSPVTSRSSFMTRQPCSFPLPDGYRSAHVLHCQNIYLPGWGGCILLIRNPNKKLDKKKFFGGMKKDNLIILSQMLYTQDEKIKTNMHIFQQSNEQDFH